MRKGQGSTREEAMKEGQASSFVNNEPSNEKRTVTYRGHYHRRKANGTADNDAKLSPGAEWSTRPSDVRTLLRHDDDAKFKLSRVLGETKKLEQKERERKVNSHSIYASPRFLFSSKFRKFSRCNSCDPTEKRF